MTDVSGAMGPWRRWKCHKEVWGEKIVDIVLSPAGPHILKFDGRFVPVSDEYMHKHNPQVGGYYVIYDDGYESFSPAKAFEEGYTLIQ